MSLEPIIYTYLAINFLMAVHSWWLDYHLNKAMGLTQPSVPVALAALAWLTLFMIPMRLMLMRKRRHR